MTKPKKGTARTDTAYLVATFENFPGVRIPLLSDAECRALGIDQPTLPIFDHMTNEEHLKTLEPLITLLAEQIARDLLEEAASTHTDPRRLRTPPTTNRKFKWPKPVNQRSVRSTPGPPPT